MLTIIFLYNLPADNHIYCDPSVMIKVEATLLTESKVCISFPDLPGYQVTAVRDWFKAFEEIKSLALTEFEQQTAVTAVKQLTAA